MSAHPRDRQLKIERQRLAAGLAATQEEQAIRVAQAHIAEGRTLPASELTDVERYGDMRFDRSADKWIHKLPHVLYVAAFYECLHARAEGREPIWRNLDLAGGYHVER
jgi:hypothetical protein